MTVARISDFDETKKSKNVLRAAYGALFLSSCLGHFKSLGFPNSQKGAKAEASSPKGMRKSKKILRESHRL